MALYFEQHRNRMGDTPAVDTLRRPLATLRKWFPDGKTILGILTFCGLSGMALIRCSEYTYQRALIFALSGAFEAHSRVDSVRTARMIQDTVRAHVDPLSGYMHGQFNQIKTYLIRVPEVRRQVSAAERARIQAERDSLDLLRAFPTP